MPKNPFRKGKRQKKKKVDSSVSDDESVGSQPSQIGFSDASNNVKQVPGQSTASKLLSAKKGPADGDNDTVTSIQTGISVDPDIRKRAITEKNASSKHNLGVFYVSKKDWPKAREYLNIALEARKEVYGKKDGRVAETEIALAEIHKAVGEKDDAIKLLKKAQAMLKALLQKPEAKDAKDDPTEKKLDLNRLAETCVEKLEELGVKTAKFVRKNASKETASNSDIFGQDYELMKSRERSLSDPDVFMQVMKTEELSQDQINKGMRGLNNEVVDMEIYYSYTFDEEFAHVEIAPLITVIPQEIPKVQEEPTYVTDSDESSDDEPNIPHMDSFIDSVSTDDNKKVDSDVDKKKGGKGGLFGNLKSTYDKFEAGLEAGLKDLVDVVQVSNNSQSDKLLDNKQEDEISMSSTSTISQFTSDTRQAQRVQRKRVKLHAVEKLSQINLLYSKGNIFEAEIKYKEKMDEWIDLLGYENPSIINMKEDLGDIEFLKRNYSEAKKHYAVACRNTKRAFDDESNNESVRLLEKLAMTNMKLMQTETAEKLYEDAIDMAYELKAFDTEIGSITEEDALFNIAKIYFKSCNYTKAKTTLAQIIRILRKEKKEANPLVLNLIGLVFYAEKKYFDAKIYFDKAFKGTKNNNHFPSRLRVKILSNLGNASNQTAMFDNAVCYFEWAIEEVQAGDFSDFDEKTELIGLYTHIGHSHFHMGNLNKAYDYYTKAYLIDINLFHDDTSQNVMNLRCYIGATRSHQGKYDDALWIFEEILYSQKTDDWPDDVTVGKVLLDMSEIYFVCGSLHLSEKHQLRLSISCCKRAFEIFNHHKLRSDHPYVKQGKQLKELMRHERYGA